MYMSFLRRSSSGGVNSGASHSFPLFWPDNDEVCRLLPVLSSIPSRHSCVPRLENGQSHSVAGGRAKKDRCPGTARTTTTIATSSPRRLLAITVAVWANTVPIGNNTSKVWIRSVRSQQPRLLNRAITMAGTAASWSFLSLFLQALGYICIQKPSSTIGLQTNLLRLRLRHQWALPLLQLSVLI